jgi:hypothetical protein
MWETLKDRLRAKNPYSLQELKDNIRREIVSISTDLRRESGNIFLRREACSEDGGQHFATLLLKE